MKHIEKQDKVKLIITEEVYNEISYLCKNIYNVEWSGLLFYDFEGSIKDPENIKITTRAILPLDKGSSTFTEYEIDERFVNFINKNEQFEDCLYGPVHSHNTMNSFFSGTDVQDLEINAPKNNIYLSLIVNNKEQMVAKLCFIANLDSSGVKAKALDETGKEYFLEVESFKENYLIVYNCDIEIRRPLRKDFIEAVEEIDKIVPRYTVYTNSIYSPDNFNKTTPYSKTYGSSVTTTSNYTYPSKKNKKNKPIKNYYITEKIPDFAVNVLIDYNERITFKDVMDVINYYVDYDIHTNVLNKIFLDNFESTFEEYFSNIKDNTVVKYILEELYAEYEEYLTVKPSKTNKYLEVLLNSIQSMIDKI